MGTATVAMILNGPGFSNRWLYLVPQFFANKLGVHWISHVPQHTESTTTGKARVLPPTPQL